MTIFLCLMAGAGIGLGVSVAIWILSLLWSLLSCTCNIISCNWNASVPDPLGGDAFLHVLLFCVIGGAVIGLIVGIVKTKARLDEETAKRNAANSEEARRQRERWAGEVKQKALQLNNSCTSNNKTDKKMVTTTYKSSSQMKEIMNELTNAAEIQGKVDSISDELARGGIRQ